jgi:hypothetical protein
MVTNGGVLFNIVTRNSIFFCCTKGKYDWGLGREGEVVVRAITGTLFALRKEHK